MLVICVLSLLLFKLVTLVMVSYWQTLKCGTCVTSRRRAKTHTCL
jgi:hypothetical protein